MNSFYAPALVLLAGLLACSDSDSPPASGLAPALEDGGTASVDGASPEAGGVDPAYVEAVLASAWKKLPNAPSVEGKQDDVFFRSVTYGLSVNGEGRIFRTEDGGDTWTKLVEKPGTFFRSIVMTSDERGFAGNIGPDYFPGVTDSAPLYETHDRGTTWTEVKSIEGPAPKGICNMHATDAEHVFAVGRVGGPSFFVSSSDGGASWTSRSMEEQLDALIDVRMTSALEGMVVGRKSNRCTVLRTTDGGASWESAFRSDVSGTLCWKLAFPSTNVGYVSIQGGKRATFAKTTDGGLTWEEKPLPETTFRGLGAGFITDEIGWMADEKGALRTTDGGETWERDPSLGPAINRFRFVDSHTAYAIGTTIYKLTIP